MVAGARGVEIGGKFIAVTAIGVYLEEAAIPAMAGIWKGKTAEELAASAEFYRDIFTGELLTKMKLDQNIPAKGLIRMRA